MTAPAEVELGAWVICIASLALLVASCGLLLLASLELSGILGPLQCGPCSCRTWWVHNLLISLLWLPTLGAAAWLEADNAHRRARRGPAAVQGGRLVEASLAMAVVMTVLHATVLMAYWVRDRKRTKAMMELPTQQLLATAALSNNPTADVGPTPSTSNPPFRLQFGRSDGAFGYTLFIPAEQEEEVLRRAMAKHCQTSSNEAGIPLASNTISSNTAVGPASGLGAKKKSGNKLRTLLDVTGEGGRDQAGPSSTLHTPPPVISLPQPAPPRSRATSPFRRMLHSSRDSGVAAHAHASAGALRGSWAGSCVGAGRAPATHSDGEEELESAGQEVPFNVSSSMPPSDDPAAQQRALDARGITLAFPGLEEQLQRSEHASPVKSPGDAHAHARGSAHSANQFTLSPQRLSLPHLQPHPAQHNQQQQLQFPLGPLAGSPSWSPQQQQQQQHARHHHSFSGSPPLGSPYRGSPLTPQATSGGLGTPADSSSFTSSISLQFNLPPVQQQQQQQQQQQLQQQELLLRASGSSGRGTPPQHQLSSGSAGKSAIAAWDEPEEPAPQPTHPMPGRLRRNKQQHRRTRSHPVMPEGAGDRLDVSLLHAGGGGGSSPERDEEEGAKPRDPRASESPS